MSDAIASAGRTIRRGSTWVLDSVESTDTRAEARPIAATIGATTGCGVAVQWITSGRRCRVVAEARQRDRGPVKLRSCCLFFARCSVRTKLRSGVCALFLACSRVDRRCTKVPFGTTVARARPSRVIMYDIYSVHRVSVSVRGAGYARYAK